MAAWGTDAWSWQDCLLAGWLMGAAWLVWEVGSGGGGGR
jgi:hypothetical protein